MESDANPKSIRSWLLTILLLVAIVGLLAAIAIPNFVGGGPSKITSVINMLRQIDAAKEYWAMQHGYTNGINPSQEISQQDIAPVFVHGNHRDYFDRFGFGFDRNGNIHGAQGVIFAINPLGISPEARFTKSFKLSDRHWFYGQKIPKGTVMRFSTNTNLGDIVEYVLPGQESQPGKSLSELLGR